MAKKNTKKVEELETKALENTAPETPAVEEVKEESFLKRTWTKHGGKLKVAAAFAAGLGAAFLFGGSKDSNNSGSVVQSDSYDEPEYSEAE